MFSITGKQNKFDASDNIYIDNDWISRIRDLMTDTYKGSGHNFKSAVKDFGAGAILNALDSDDCQAFEDLADNIGFYFAFEQFETSYQGKFASKTAIGQWYIESGMFEGKIPQSLYRFIDFDAVADDMELGNYWISDNMHLFLLT